MYKPERIDVATCTRTGLIGPVLILLGLAFPSGAWAASISLVPTTSITNVQPGETVKFNVEMDFTDDQTTGGGFDIVFDSSALQFVGIVRDTTLGDEENFGRNPDIETGRLAGWCVGDSNGLPLIATLGYVEFQVLPSIGKSTVISTAPEGSPTCGAFVSFSTLQVIPVNYNGAAIATLVTRIDASGMVTNSTGALASLAPVSAPITGPVRVDAKRGTTVGPANILSMDVSVNGNCFTTQSPTMCPPEDEIVPIISIDSAEFIVDIGSDTGTLEFTAFSPAFDVNIPVSINLDSNTLFTDGVLGSLNATMTFVAETDGDGIPDIDDLDDDNDNVRDGLDPEPAVPDNNCSDGDSDNATLVGMIMDSRMCAANVSVVVQGGTDVTGPDADLRVIAPSIVFQSDFSAVKMSVFTESPCEGC